MAGGIDLSKVGNFYSNGVEYTLELRAAVGPNDDPTGSPLDGRVLSNAPGPDLNAIATALAEIGVTWLISQTDTLPEGAVYFNNPGEISFSLLSEVNAGIRLDSSNLKFITPYALVNAESGIVDGSNYVELTPQQLIDNNYFCAGIYVTLPSSAEAASTIKRLLISIPNIESDKSLQIKIGDQTTLVNRGPTESFTTVGDTSTLCLKERQVNNEPVLPSFKSMCFEMDGKFAVEINGEVVPFIFRPEDLPKYFNDGNSHGIKFEECKEIFICTPQQIQVSYNNLLNREFAAGEWSLKYSVNDGPVEEYRVTVTNNQYKRGVFANIIAHIFAESNIDANYVEGGGGVANFQYLGNELIGSSGVVESNITRSIKMYRNPVDGNDLFWFFFDYFDDMDSSDFVEAISCGTEEFPGY